MYVISPDLPQDYDSAQGSQNDVVDYLKEISYSRHYMGDVSFSLLDFGFPTERKLF